MKSMMLTGIRQMEMREVPDPKIANDNDVLLKLDMVGICGSDVHYYTTGRIGSQVVDFPFTVGHECAATVKEIGAKVTTVKPGDRVAVEPAVSCGECTQCRMGRPHTCYKLNFLGCPGQLAGCLSELLVMPETSCLPLPEGMTTEQGTLAEPLTIGVYAVEQSLPMPGAKIAIFGSGPIGLSVLAGARAEGVDKVYMTDRIDARTEVASKAGATWAGNPDRGDAVAQIMEAEPEGVDVAFECAGQQESFDQALEVLRPGGKLMLIGIPEFDRYSFAADIARRREACIQHVRRQNHCAEKTIELLASGKVEVDYMITHRFPFAQTQAGFDLVDKYADGVIKALVTFD